MQSIVRVTTVCKELGVSKSKAHQLIKNVIKAYKFDPDRLPVQGSCPMWAFIEYYQLEKSIFEKQKAGDVDSG